MRDSTISTKSPVGHHLDAIAESKAATYLMFNNQKINLVAKITLGRATDNSIVVDNKLASRYHAIIQKIKDDYFLKDLTSTNGTFLNGAKLPTDKYVKRHVGDKITIGNSTLVFS